MRNIKLGVIAIVFVFAGVGYFGILPDYSKVKANRSGPPPSFTNAPGEGNCTACHSDFPVNTGKGSVVISGVPTEYVPGSSISVTVTTTQFNTIAFGFQITAIDSLGNGVGSFSTGTQNTVQITTAMVDGRGREYVEHTIDGTTGSGSRSWTFTWLAPSTDVGPITFYAAGNGADDDGSTANDFIFTTSFVSNPQTTNQIPAQFDFDGDGKTDIGIFRANVGQWWIQRSGSLTTKIENFGVSTDIPVPADYTGDGITDIAFFRPSNGEWFVLRSEDSSFFSFPFGAGSDIPVPSDFDNDGKADPAVFRPSTATWFILQSNGPTRIEQFGAPGDVPVVGDYDGDGKADKGIFRQNVGQWWLNQSSNNVTTVQNFGVSTDKTVQGDYTGDGKTDVAFFRPSSGEWFILRSEDSSFFSFPFGVGTDIPAPGDYDGDGKQDAAVFRPSTATWFINGSQAGFIIQQFGATGDFPIPNAYVR